MKKICSKCGKEKYFDFPWQDICTDCKDEMNLAIIREKIVKGEPVDTGSDKFVICPYCGAAIETDLGYEDFPELYIEGDSDIDCPECEKTFTMNTEISYYYSTRKKVE